MPTDLTGQQLRLVEPALPPPPPMQRHRHDDVEALLAWKRLRQESTEGPSQRQNAVELK